MSARQGIPVAERLPEAAVPARVAPRLNGAVCLECGAAFDRAGDHGTFCGAKCRLAWNNRRLQRGAEIYDLLMTLRFERRSATGVFTALCRAAAAFRAADHAERAGRASWSNARTIIARRPYLNAAVVLKRGTRKRT